MTNLSHNPEAIVAELEALLARGTNIFGRVVIDQETFFLLMTKLKQGLLGIGLGRNAVAVAQEIDAMELLVENGQFPVFGKVMVDKQTYEKHLQQLKLLL